MRECHFRAGDQTEYVDLKHRFHIFKGSVKRAFKNAEPRIIDKNINRTGLLKRRFNFIRPADVQYDYTALCAGFIRDVLLQSIEAVSSARSQNDLRSFPCSMICDPFAKPS